MIHILQLDSVARRYQSWCYLRNQMVTIWAHRVHTQSIFRRFKNISAKLPNAEDDKWDLSTSKNGYRSNTWCKKCVEIVFKYGKIIKGQGLQILLERMKAWGRNENEKYKFLGAKKAERIDMEMVMERPQSNIAESKRICGRRVIWQKSGKSDKLLSDHSRSLNDECM